MTGEPRTAPAANAPRRSGLLVGLAATVVGVLLAAFLWISKPSGPRPPVLAEQAGGTTASAPHVQAGTPQETSSPRAVGVTFARDVKGVLPVEEGDTFYRDDRKVMLWVRWANVRGKHTTVTRWFNPEEELVYTSPSPESFESPADWWTTWTTLPLRREMAVKAGRWRAEVQLDNQPLVTAHFSLLDRPRPAAASLPSAGKP